MYKTTHNPAFLDSLRRSANAQKVSFRISLKWPADKTKLSCNTSHRCNTTISLQTYTFYSFKLLCLPARARSCIQSVSSSVRPSKRQSASLLVRQVGRHTDTSPSRNQRIWFVQRRVNSLVLPQYQSLTKIPHGQTHINTYLNEPGPSLFASPGFVPWYSSECQKEVCFSSRNTVCKVSIGIMYHLDTVFGNVVCWCW